MREWDFESGMHNVQRKLPSGKAAALKSEGLLFKYHAKNTTDFDSDIGRYTISIFFNFLFLIFLTFVICIFEW